MRSHRIVKILVCYVQIDSCSVQARMPQELLYLDEIAVATFQQQCREGMPEGVHGYAAGGDVASL